MKNILLVTDVNFWEKGSGNRMRVYNLIKYLVPMVNLTVVNTGPAHPDIEAMINQNYNFRFYILEKNKYLSSNGYGRRFRVFIKDKNFDAIIIEYIHSSYFLNYLDNDKTKIILDAHDIISERTEEFKKFNYEGALYELTKETEFRIFEVYDRVMLLCKADFDKVAGVIGENKTLLCPHPVNFYKQTVKRKVKSIAFVASSYLPNLDAINYFIENCWPTISRNSDVNLFVYGTVCDQLSVVESERIILKGFVSDLEQVYEDADIIINPVRFGAGVKIKNIEAMGYGIPLVTTSHGARGLEGQIETCFLVADNPNDFSKKVLLLINDYILRVKIGNNAYSYISTHLNEEICFAPLINFLNQIPN